MTRDLLGENPTGLAAAVGRELGVLLIGIAAGVLLVRQPAKNVCPGPMLDPKCLEFASFTDTLLHVTLVAGAVLLVASAALDTHVGD